MHFFVKVKKDKKKEKKAKEDVVAAESMKKRKKDKVGFSCPIRYIMPHLPCIYILRFRMWFQIAGISHGISSERLLACVKCVME